MKRIFERLAHFNECYYRLLRGLLTILLGLIIVPVVLQVVSRFVAFIPRYIWTEEAARFCFVWLIMIGSIIAVREGTHFEVELFPQIASPRIEGARRLVVHFLMLLMAFAFVVYGYDFARLGYMQSSEMIGINMVSIYVAFPVAGGSWLLFLLEKIRSDILLMRGSREGEAL